MALRGHVFTKQLFSSECFALFIDTFLDGESGIIHGCTLSNTTTKITLNKGYFLAKGRFLEEEEGIDFSIESTASGVKFCKLICEIDLSKENTTSILNQAYYKIIEDDEDYPELEQDDITTDTTGIYQFEFCQFKRTTSGISDFRDTREFVDFDSIYSNVRTQVENAIEDAEEDFDTWFSAFQNTSENDFNVWFQTIVDILDENVAGHLLNLINAMHVKTFTIPTSAWTLNSTTGLYEAIINDLTVKSYDNADVSFNAETYEIALGAGIKGYVTELQNTGIKLFADRVPADSVSGKYNVERGVANG